MIENYPNDEMRKLGKGVPAQVSPSSLALGSKLQDLIILNHGQVTRTTSEWNASVRTCISCQREDFKPRQISRKSAPLHGRSLAALGLELMTRWSRVRDHGH
ncbi:hypothetical protein TNCV_1532001 [Trichonephila clavipes]|nr:hypothetical protein TNCV_1532001 [Trichonephila clavipes]